jgi:hypothetical protein
MIIFEQSKATIVKTKTDAAGRFINELTIPDLFKVAERFCCFYFCNGQLDPSFRFTFRFGCIVIPIGLVPTEHDQGVFESVLNKLLPIEVGVVIDPRVE